MHYFKALLKGIYILPFRMYLPLKSYEISYVTGGLENSEAGDIPV